MKWRVRGSFLCFVYVLTPWEHARNKMIDSSLVEILGKSPHFWQKNAILKIHILFYICHWLWYNGTIYNIWRTYMILWWSKMTFIILSKKNILRKLFRWMVCNMNYILMDEDEVQLYVREKILIEQCLVWKVLLCCPKIFQVISLTSVSHTYLCFII